MPKLDIDYSNTIIYKITCKDSTITDVYVGHTTNFVQRKHAHKQSCINVKSANYGLKLYEVIRNNGGWINWKMDIINFFDCKDHYAARKKEQEYFISLNATLNSIEPLPKPKVKEPLTQKKEKELFFCQTCNIDCNSSKLLEEHNKNKKHNRKLTNIEMDIKPSAISAHIFYCKNCEFKCSKKSDWERHIARAKHIRIQNDTEKTQKEQPYKCVDCDKVYKYHSGLWKHKKICIIPQEQVNVNVVENNNIIEFLIKENSEFKNFVLEIVKNNTEIVKSNTELQKQNNELQKQVLEVCKNSTTNIIQTNSHNNSNNKTFNLQFFLNEQCKDAMNITDFVNSFDLQLSDLESVGELGYVEGITKLMVDKLNSMDIYKRPIHCSDAKRETLYVKDDNKWEKEERNNPKLRYAIKTISFRNMKLANLWSETYPESMKYDSHLNDTYIRIIKESTGGQGEISVSEDKIIRRIAKEILIEKS